MGTEKREIKNNRRSGVYKHRTRRLSIKAKILVPTAVIVAAVCCFMALLFKSRMETDMVMTGAEMAAYVGSLAEDDINGTLLEMLSEGGEDTTAYRVLSETMNETKEGSAIRFMYTLFTDGSKVYYGVDLDEEDQRTIGEEFDEPYSKLKAVFEEGAVVKDDKIIVSDNIPTISAYVPVYNTQDEIVGAIGCDYDASGIVAAVNETMRNVVIIGIGCFVAAVVLFGLIISRITRNLWRVDDRIYDIVNSNGDLTQTIQMRTGDEIESIAGHVNELLAYMRRIMTNISDNSQKLNSSSKSVVSHLKDTQANVSEVSATMEEMSATMDETAVSLNEVQNSVTEVYEFIEQINNRTQEGSRLSDEIKESAQRIQSNAIAEQQAAKQQTKQITESVYARIEESREVEKIGELTANIINITDQTNLLSLNASIEAARAGEAGRGFAVVADEIGKLAMDSASAAEQIQTVSTAVIQAVNALADEAAHMVEFMEASALKGYSDLVDTSEEYNKEAGKINEMMQVFEEQAEQLQNNMDSIRQVIEMAGSSVEESAQGVSRISQMSANINENVTDIEGQADANMDIADMLDGEVNKFQL